MRLHSFELENWFNFLLFEITTFFKSIVFLLFFLAQLDLKNEAPAYGHQTITHW